MEGAGKPGNQQGPMSKNESRAGSRSDWSTCVPRVGPWLQPQDHKDKPTGKRRGESIFQTTSQGAGQGTAQWGALASLRGALASVPSTTRGLKACCYWRKPRRAGQNTHPSSAGHRLEQGLWTKQGRN